VTIVALEKKQLTNVNVCVFLA